MSESPEVPLAELLNRPAMRPGEARLAWADCDFSVRMLAEHLDDRHDLASRRAATIDEHVHWLESLLPTSGGRVLDLGCGPGLYLERLASAGCSAVGVDLAPAAIDHATARARGAGCAVRVHPRRLPVRRSGQGVRSRAVFRRAQHHPDQRLAAGVRSHQAAPAAVRARCGRAFDSVRRSREGDPSGSTTWWHGPLVEAALSSAGLAIDQRHGDLGGRPPQDGDAFETLVLRRV